MWYLYDSKNIDFPSSYIIKKYFFVNEYIYLLREAAEKIKVPFLLARPLRGGGGLATKKKELFLTLWKKIQKNSPPKNVATKPGGGGG